MRPLPFAIRRARLLSISEGFARPGGNPNYDDPIYVTDALDPGLTEVGRYAFIKECLAASAPIGSSTPPAATWALCQGDVERFDLKQKRLNRPGGQPGAELQHVRRPELADQLASAFGSSEHLPKYERLSDREFQVLRLIALGGTPKSIGHQLGLSDKTISTFRRNILHKLGLQTNDELVRYALQHGLVVSSELAALDPSWLPPSDPGSTKPAGPS